MVPSESKNCCPSCGKPLASTRLRGHCPACMVKGLGAAPVPPEDGIVDAGQESLMFRIPGHDVLGEIARGGMGIVYRARQHHPAREVALKMLLPGGATPALRERFRNEARTMADLNHPGILPLYQFGEHGGTPWFTMKLAGGGSLADRVKAGTAADSPRQAAALMAEIADAVAYAHERGVLHRDLKPGNILFDADGRASVADFGLAKLDSQSAAGLTHSRAMLGTPHYLAPELAAKAGTTATVTTDVYALGAILYELLAGRPPFQSETIAGLLRSIVEDDPPSLLSAKTTLTGSVPRGLAAITGKALSKEPARRYQGAAALAADLRAWLAGEAIEARPPGAWEKASRWMRRHPAWTAGAAALLAGLSAVIFLQAKSARELRTERDTAESARQSAVASRAEALVAQVAAARLSGNLDLRQAALDAAREAAPLTSSPQLRDDVITLLSTPGWEVRPPVTCPGNAEIAPISPDHDFMVSLHDGRLTLHDLSGKEPPLPLPPLSQPVQSVTFITRQARYIACRDVDRVHHLYDRGQHRWIRDWPQPSWGFALSADEKRLAWGVDGKQEIVIEELLTGKELQRFPSVKKQPFPRAFSPDGKRLAVAGASEENLEIIDLTTGKMRHDLSALSVNMPAIHPSWRPDSLGLAIAMGAADIFTWSLDGNPPVKERATGHQAEVLDVAWHPDGRWFASCGFDGTLRIWESPSRREIHRVQVICQSVHWSRDGTELAAFQYGGGKMHRFGFTPPVGTAQCPLPRTSPDKHMQRPSWGCALTPDGLLGVALSDYGMHYFDASSGRHLAFKVTDRPFDLLFNAKGDMLIAAGPKGILPIPVKRTEILGQETILPGMSSRYFGEEAYRAGWSDARQRLAWTADSGVYVRDLPDGEIRKMPAMPFHLNPCTLSPDGKWIAASGGDHSPDGLVLWNVDAPAPPLVLPGFRKYTYMRFSADSRLLFAYTDDRICALATGTWETVWNVDRSTQPQSQHQLALSGDGTILAAVEPPSRIGLYEAATGRPIAALRHPDVRWVGWIAMDHAGSRLIATTLPDSVICWDLRVLRRQLGELGLDWESPPYPPAPPHKDFLIRFLPDISALAPLK